VTVLQDKFTESETQSLALYDEGTTQCPTRFYNGGQDEIIHAINIQQELAYHNVY